MLNKKTISVVTAIITIGIGLILVGLSSSTEPQPEITENTDTTKITGKYAEAICDIIGIPCPENTEFDGRVGENDAVKYKYADKKSIYFFKISDQQLEFMGKKFIDGEWQVVADEWTVLIKQDMSSAKEKGSETMVFEEANGYDENGLKINFAELREISKNTMIPGYDKHPTTIIDKNSMYAVVSEVQNTEGIKKDFYYEVSLRHPNGDVETSAHKETILPYDSVLVDGGGHQMYPGEYAIDVYVYEKRSVRDQTTPFSQVLFLEEKENKN